MTTTLPKGYKEGISRVSDVVSFIYPFDTNSQDRYKKWLNKEDIDEDEYLEEAQVVGTFVHQQIENYITKTPQEVLDPLYTIHNSVIKKGIEFVEYIKKEKWKEEDGWKYIAEPYILEKNNRWQGSVDLVIENKKKKEVVILDWKTWGIAKARWNLDNKNKKPYAKLKKVKLQMSLYAEVYRQNGWNINTIGGVWLREEEAILYNEKAINTEELETLIKPFFKKHLFKETKNIMYEIEILLPTEQYGNIKLKADLSKIDNGLTEKEIIDGLIKKAEYVRSKIKNKN